MKKESSHFDKMTKNQYFQENCHKKAGTQLSAGRRICFKSGDVFYFSVGTPLTYSQESPQ